MKVSATTLLISFISLLMYTAFLSVAYTQLGADKWTITNMVNDDPLMLLAVTTLILHGINQAWVLYVRCKKYHCEGGEGSSEESGTMS